MAEDTDPAHQEPKTILAQCAEDKESQVIIDIRDFLIQGPIARLSNLIDSNIITDEGQRRQVQNEIDQLKLVGQNLRMPVPPRGSWGTPPPIPVKPGPVG